MSSDLSGAMPYLWTESVISSCRWAAYVQGVLHYLSRLAISLAFSSSCGMHCDFGPKRHVEAVSGCLVITVLLLKSTNNALIDISIKWQREASDTMQVLHQYQFYSKSCM